jgi:hypothetical protein
MRYVTFVVFIGVIGFTFGRLYQGYLDLQNRTPISIECKGGDK